VVSERRPGAAASAVGGGDSVGITIAPANLLVPLTTYSYDQATQRWGIKIGSTSYANPAPNGVGMQVLIVDRSTLAVQNGYVQSASQLNQQVSGLGTNKLVILFNPPNQNAPVAATDVPTFNKALGVLGLPALDKTLLTNHRQILSLIGVPRSNAGSGWWVPGGHTGWLTPDTSGLMAFSPRRVDFDSSSANTATTNTMTVGDQQVTANVPSGNGYHVVEIDPLGGGVVNSFAYNSVTDLPDLVDRLVAETQANLIVAIQSVGPKSSTTDDMMNPLLLALGGSPGAFQFQSGYSLLGGNALTPSNVLEASDGVVTDPTTSPPTTAGHRIVTQLMPTHSGGTLAPRGRTFPGAQEGVDNSLALYDIAHMDPTPWPYTQGAQFPQQQGCDAPGDDPVGYANALIYIASNIGLSAYATNLRTAYVEDDQATWSDEKLDLQNLAFEEGHRFSAAQFCNLKAELQSEFDWLDNVKTMFDSYKQPYDRSSAVDAVDLQQIGTTISDALKPPDDTALGWDVFSIISEVFNLASFLPEEEVGALLDSVMTAYDISSEFANQGGSPVGDRLASKVSALSSDTASLYANVAAGLDNTRDIVVDDYGKLSTLGPVANGPPWNIDSNSIEQFTSSLETSAKAWYVQELMAVGYGVYLLMPSSSKPVTTEFCFTGGGNLGYPFQGEPLNGQLAWDTRNYPALSRLAMLAGSRPTPLGFPRPI
jgi:hypothetical protein